MSFRLVVLLACATVLSAAPLTPDKLQLIPEFNPSKRRELARKMQPLMGKDEGVAEALILAGVHETVARRVAELSSGPLLVERYAHGLVLEAPDLTPRQKEILEYLHPSVLAAQFAIYAHKQRVMHDLAQDDASRGRLAASFDLQIREIEKRYWRMIGYVLSVDQRAALHAFMPQRYLRPPNLQAHVYQLPGVTPSQAARLRALFTEYEAETAPDVAELRRLRGEKSSEARRAAEAATDRIATVVEATVERGRAILTAEQMKHLDALPPLLTPQERGRHPGEILKYMALTPEMQEKVKALGQKLQERVAESQRRAQEKLKELKGEVGSDSPQAMTMHMMAQGANAEKMLAFEDAAHVAFTEVVDAKRLLGWILAPR